MQKRLCLAPRQQVICTRSGHRRSLNLIDKSHSLCPAASICSIHSRPLTRAPSRHQQVRDSIVVSISACHAEDPGSIPGRGVSVHHSNGDGSDLRGGRGWSEKERKHSRIGVGCSGVVGGGWGWVVGGGGVGGRAGGGGVGGGVLVIGGGFCSPEKKQCRVAWPR